MTRMWEYCSSRKERRSSVVRDVQDIASVKATMSVNKTLLAILSRESSDESAGLSTTEASVARRSLISARAVLARGKSLPITQPYDSALRIGQGSGFPSNPPSL